MTDFDLKLQRISVRFDYLSRNVEPFLMQTLKGREAEIEDLNLAQLEAGKDSTGKAIKPDYTPFTKAIKQAKGQPSDRVTLKDEGDFHKSITYKVEQKALAYDATDPKTEALEDKYGEEILGLDEASLGEVANMILDSIYQQTKDYLLK